VHGEPPLPVRRADGVPARAFEEEFHDAEGLGEVRVVRLGDRHMQRKIPLNIPDAQRAGPLLDQELDHSQVDAFAGKVSVQREPSVAIPLPDRFGPLLEKELRRGPVQTPMHAAAGEDDVQREPSLAIPLPDRFGSVQHEEPSQFGPRPAPPSALLRKGVQGNASVTISNAQRPRPPPDQVPGGLAAVERADGHVNWESAGFVALPDGLRIHP
jgi:hypothetical protein